MKLSHSKNKQEDALNLRRTDFRLNSGSDFERDIGNLAVAWYFGKRFSVPQRSEGSRDKPGAIYVSSASESEPS